MARASTQGARGFNGLSNSINRTGRSALTAERRVKRLAKTVWALRTLGGGVTSLGISGLGSGYPLVMGIKQFADYEDALISIRKVWTGSQQDYEKIVVSLRKLNQQIPLSRSAIAGLMEEGIRAKVSKTDNPDEYIDFTRLAAKFMVAFNLSASEAPQILAKLKSQLGLTTKEFEEFGDTLNTVANSFSTNEREMLEGMKRVGGLAKSLAGMQGVKDASAILGAQMAAGTPKEVAATGLRTLIARLSTQPATTKKALRNLGLDAKQIKKDLPADLFGTIYKVLYEISKLKPEERAGTLSLLAGMKSFDAFSRLLSRADLLKEVKDVVEGQFRLTMASEFERRIKGLNSLFQITKNILADTSDSIVKQWGPQIASALASVQKWAKSVDGSKMLAWAAGILAIFSALSLVIVPLGVFVFAAKALIPALMLLVSPVTILAGAIIGLGIAFGGLDLSKTISDLNRIKSSISQKWSTSELKTVIDYLGTISDKIGSQLSSVLSALASDNPLAKMFREALNVVTEILGSISKLPDFILNPGKAIKGMSSWLGEKAMSAAKSVAGIELPKLPTLRDPKVYANPMDGGSLAKAQADKQMALKVQTDNQVTIDAPGTIILKLPDGTVAGRIPLKGSVVSKGVTTPDAVGP